MGGLILMLKVLGEVWSSGASGPGSKSSGYSARASAMDMFGGGSTVVTGACLVGTVDCRRDDEAANCSIILAR